MLFFSNFKTKSLKKVSVPKKKIWLWKFARLFFVALFLYLIVFFWANISSTLWSYFKNIAWSATKFIAKNISKEPKKDTLWNVNILLLGIWWKNHDGGYLTDTIMIASFNLKLKTLTFLSIPRDLYVKYNKYSWWRINYIFAKEYLKTRNYEKAAQKLKEKINQITWIKINYFVVVDFGGFEKFIDTLWGITINVPYNLVDTRYPGPNRTYTTFKITKWIHHLDGATALKYARSRHSTSDFSRSARQEQIIKAIIKKLTTSWILFSPSKLKNLYLQFSNTVKTDMDFETILSFIPYAKELKIHSYVLHADCYYKKTYWKNLTPWCFVYPAKRDDFNWQAVLLPVWANSLNVEVYDQTKKFAFIALWYPELWLENAKIQILNWISKIDNKRKFGYSKPLASKLAYKLKNYGFNVVDVWNASKYFNNNTLYIYNSKPVTQDLLLTFVGKMSYKTWDVKYAGSGFDMTLILGKKYLDNFR